MLLTRLLPSLPCIFGLAQAALPVAKQVSELIQSMPSSDRYYVAPTSETLAKLGMPAVKPLIRLLRDAQPRSRWCAALALGRIGDSSAVRPLIITLDDRDENVRCGAAEALGRLGDPRAVPGLWREAGREKLWPPDAYEALVALGRLGDTSAIDSIADRLHGRRRYWRAWPAMLALVQVGGVRAIRAVGAMIQDTSPDMRLTAVRALGTTSDTTAVRFLATALSHSDSGVRVKALTELVRADSANALPILRREVNSRFPDLRAKAARLLLPSDLTEITPDLRMMYDHPDPNVRAAAFDGLGRLVGSVQKPWQENLVAAWMQSRRPAILHSAIVLLKGGLNDESEIARRTAAYSIAYTRDTEVTATRLAALNDPDSVVRRYMVASFTGYVCRDNRVGPAITPFLKDRDLENRFNAILFLGDQEDPLATRPLLAMLPSPDEQTRAAVAWAFTNIRDTAATQALIRLLRDSSARVRWWSAAALGGQADSRAVSPLLAAVDDSEWTVALTAIGALAMIGDTLALPVLARAARGLATADRSTNRWLRLSMYATRALGMMGRPARQTLASLLEDADSLVRKKAAEMLAGSDSAFAIQVFRGALQRKDLWAIAGAYPVLLQYGVEGHEPTMIQALNKVGDPAMAEAFAKSGNARLRRAAKGWKMPAYARELFPANWNDRIGSPFPWQMDWPPSWWHY